MIKPSFRDGIVQAVDQVMTIANQKGFKVEIETDDNGELITYTDRKVIITFSYTFDLEPNLMDFRLFTLEFSVFGSVTVTRFDNKTFDIIKFIRCEFEKIYTPLKKSIASDKTNYGFNRAFQELTKGLKTMDHIFNLNDCWFRVYNYLTVRGFDVPSKQTDFHNFIQDMKSNHSEVFNEMVREFLRVDDVVNMMIKSDEVRV
jgi:hypothetical protein